MITSNQYYGAINRRFDKRAKFLRKLGFKYTITDYGAMFVRGNRKFNFIPATVVSLADSRVWIDELSRHLTRGN